MYSEPSSENPLNACTFCGRQQLNSREYNHIRDTLHQLSPAELENRGFCFVCLNEQNILWQLITDHDDIFQTHIVCKLNGADLKFLNQANSESREAMKRSKNVASVPGKFNGTNALRFEIEANSRETLRRTFSSHHLAPFSSTHHQIFSFDLISRSVLFDFQLTTYRLLSLTSSFFFYYAVGEFSSKETLEWAWQRWTREEEEFCSLVCEINDLELLKWAREEKQCRWDATTSWEAASKGNMKTLNYLCEENCPMDEQTCAEAAENGHWEVLKFLREMKKVPWDHNTTSAAAAEGNFEMLKWCRQRECPWNIGTSRGACQSGHLEMLKWAMANGCMANETTMSEAAEYGQLQCLIFLRSQGVNWDYRTCKMAMKHGHRDVYEYAVENGCPTQAPEPTATHHHHPHHHLFHHILGGGPGGGLGGGPGANGGGPAPGGHMQMLQQQQAAAAIAAAQQQQQEQDEMELEEWEAELH